MLSEQQLRALALNRARTHLDGILRSAVEVEIEATETEWDATDLRMVFAADMVVWHATGTFEVVLDEADQPVGFIDEDKWTGCQWIPLPRVRLLELAMGTGFVAETAAIADVRKGEGNCAELTLTSDAARPDAPRMLVRINPATERVISILPMDLQS